MERRLIHVLPRAPFIMQLLPSNVLLRSTCHIQALSRSTGNRLGERPGNPPLVRLAILYVQRELSLKTVNLRTCIIKTPTIYSLIQSNNRRPNHFDGSSTSQYIPSAAKTVTSKETMKATPVALE
jgi:hypothetical protein